VATGRLKAAELGDHDAMTEMAVAWHNGRVLPKSNDKAWEFAWIPARHGNLLAQTFCGIIKADLGEHDEAVQWLTLAAAQGHSQVQMKLGTLFQGKTPLMESSPFAAHYWLKKAALQNCREAQSLMAAQVTEIAELVSQGNTSHHGYCPYPNRTSGRN
jgi:TPR repeat protein